ncbi:MAG TPA: hypothetical protein VFU01_13630 [Gemmatimonadaceae bacterium]|nr:hypothetical protein [Gemmatimonadaceae bacterium]
MKSRRGVILFTVFWLLAALDMTFTYVRNPYDPSLMGTTAYGHTSPGELTRMLTILAGELVLFLAILRPWSYRQSWLRALFALVILSPWLLLWGPIGLHAGPTTHAHTTWLLVLWVGLFAVLVVSAVSRVAARSKPDAPAA